MLKTILFGTPKTINNRFLDSTPAQFGATLLAGHALANYVPVTNSLSHSFRNLESGVRRGNMVVAVKNLHRCLVCIKQMIDNGFSQSKLDSIVANVVNWFVEISGMTLIEILISVVASSLLSALYMAASYSAQVRKILFGQNLKTKEVYEDFKELWQNNIDTAMNWVLSIAALVCRPESTISVAILMGWRMLDKQLWSDSEWNCTNASEILREALFDASGLPIWVAICEVVFGLGARLITGPETSVTEEQHSIGTLAALISLITSGAWF